MSSKDYIKWIRKKVGHSKIMLVHAGGCIFNDAGEILLQRRGDCNKWGFPGGIVELGETPEEASIREIKEETGLNVTIKNLIGVYTDANVTCANGDKFQSVLIAYTFNISSGTLCCDQSETLELKFFPLSKVPPLFCKQHEDILNDVKARY